MAYFYEEWDAPGSVLPASFRLTAQSTVQEALQVFYAAGGYAFFKVTDPEYYSPAWLAFVGGLYRKIEEGQYRPGDAPFQLPLTEAQRLSLIQQGVPAVFTNVNEEELQ